MRISHTLIKCFSKLANIEIPQSPLWLNPIPSLEHEGTYWPISEDYISNLNWRLNFSDTISTYFIFIFLGNLQYIWWLYCGQYFYVSTFHFFIKIMGSSAVHDKMFLGSIISKSKIVVFFSQAFLYIIGSSLLQIIFSPFHAAYKDVIVQVYKMYVQPYGASRDFLR